MALQLIKLFRLNLLKKVHPKGTILDFGSGPGNNLPFLLSLEPQKIIEVDFSPEMLKLAKKKCSDVRVSYVNSSYDLYASLEKFDLIICHYSFVHVPTQCLPVLLKKVASWLKPDGLFFSNYFEGGDKTHLLTSDWGEQKEVKRYFTHYSKKFLNKLYRQNNLNVVKVVRTTGKNYNRLHFFARRQPMV